MSCVGLQSCFRFLPAHCFAHVFCGVEPGLARGRRMDGRTAVVESCGDIGSGSLCRGLTALKRSVRKQLASSARLSTSEAAGSGGVSSPDAVI